ncbi:hypothetical protein QBC35DRAFT_458701 [Podospora australis]|uniref:Calcium influx-promoting protein ehs1 n=1 Tax=Podospora australis TaxID=1536484 RepID=A0AAN6X306_9PEZI|nr:hypothetical protein QBC35DRAFT_458701 [Podospora australis]
MQLSPLQSRLAASVAASCLLILLYWTLFSPHFAVAAELKRTLPIIYDDLDFSPNPAARSPLDPTYEPEFAPFGRSIIGRADGGLSELRNNEPLPMDLPEGSTTRFIFPLQSISGRESEGQLELRSEHDELVEEPEAGQAPAKRQSSRMVYISANTCYQPKAIDPSKTTMEPPQLTLFISRDPDHQAPGPLADSSTQTLVVFKEGAAMYNLSATGDVYIAVHAPNVSDVFEGIYNFKIAVSLESHYFSYNERDDADLIWVDSDSQGALLYTHNLTESTEPTEQAKIMSSSPYVLFAHDKNDTAINGLKFSYCGLQNHAQIAAIKDGRESSKVRTSMTKRGQGNLPKQQFFFSGLDPSTHFWGILARDGNWLSGKEKRQEDPKQPGGGGQVFRSTEFETKSDHGNCALITDLEFCDEVAYSVPSNPKFGNSTELAKFYDKYAAEIYDNFNKSLQQIQCEAIPQQRYSLVRNCTDCANAYKTWLCSVTIPRCEDFDKQADYLQPRAVFEPFPNGEKLSQEVLKDFPNTTTYRSSRNPRIDEFIKPGPYKELLPCEDLCYDLVRSCPAVMGFGCPQPDGLGFKGNYMTRDKAGELRCNFQGSAHVTAGASRGALSPVFLGLSTLVALGFAWAI